MNSKSMKTISQNQQDTQNKNNLPALENVNNMSVTHAMITNVELSNGQNTALVTLFDSKLIGFEEVKIGVNKGLEFQENIITEQSTLYALNNGNLDKFCDYDKRYIRPLKAVC